MVEVKIKIGYDQDSIVLIVEDNGRGFEPDEVPPGHFGLQMMTERVDQIGGELSIESKPSHGTKINVRWTERSVS